MQFRSSKLIFVVKRLLKLGNLAQKVLYLAIWLFYNNICSNYSRIKYLVWLQLKCVDHVIWTGHRISHYFCCCGFLMMLWNTFWVTFKVQKRLGDIIMKIAEQFFLLFVQGVNKKVNKHFNIWHQFQNSTPCPNGMIHS